MRFHTHAWRRRRFGDALILAHTGAGCRIGERKADYLEGFRDERPSWNLRREG
jgi:hypothetical protein